jgi:SAM-dependent methyltransferase
MGFAEVFSQNVFLRWIAGRGGGTDLAVTMSGPRLGERLLQVGLADTRLVVGLAGKIGLSGRACGIDPDATVVARAQASAEKQGVLVELQHAPPSLLPFDAGDFDLVVIDLATAGSAAGHDLGGAFREAWRVLRPGGRCVALAKAARGGALGAFGRRAGRAAPGPAEIVREMQASGFRAARLLAEREGLAFVEGLRSAA